MKAKDLTHKHIGQRFKLAKDIPSVEGGLSDFEHVPATPDGGIAMTILWLNGLELRISPYTPLTFITKGTPT